MDWEIIWRSLDRQCTLNGRWTGRACVHTQTNMDFLRRRRSVKHDISQSLANSYRLQPLITNVSSCFSYTTLRIRGSMYSHHGGFRSVLCRFMAATLRFLSLRACKGVIICFVAIMSLKRLGDCTISQRIAPNISCHIVIDIITWLRNKT